MCQNTNQLKKSSIVVSLCMPGNLSTPWQHAAAHEKHSERQEYDEEESIVHWLGIRRDGRAREHDERLVLPLRQAPMPCGVVRDVGEVQETRRALPRAADVCPPPREVEFSEVQA